MQNLEQIRAKNALAAAKKYNFAGKDDGEVVKKVPTMIRENGILGAAAFASASEKGGGYDDVFKAICEHLKDPQIGKITESADAKSLVSKLSDADSAKLRAVTTEAMAYLNYLRRFAKK